MTSELEQLPARPQSRRPVEPYDRWKSVDGEETALFYRESDEYVVRFPDRADFIISLDRQTVTCTPEPGVTDDAIAILYHNQIIPLILGCNGDLVLHASATVVDGQAVAFIGTTGRGKSTLAAAFARAGHPFLTDDGLILDRDGEGYTVRPREPVIRLSEDSAAAILKTEVPPPGGNAFKERILASGEIPFHGGPAPLAAIYLLTESQQPGDLTTSPLSQPAALSALLKHAFILDVEDRSRVTDMFHRLAGVAERIGCYTLDYPRRYAELPKVLSSIIAHVQGREARS